MGGMKTPLLAALGFLCLFVSVSRAETTEEMVSKCRAITSAKVTSDHVQLPPDFDSGFCWGAFDVVSQMMVMTTTDSHDKPFFQVCLPGDSTRTQLIQVFEQYSIKHPERYHEDFMSVVHASLREAFPYAAHP
jgi:Rap1a immunity proteins